MKYSEEEITREMEVNSDRTDELVELILLETDVDKKGEYLEELVLCAANYGGLVTALELVKEMKNYESKMKYESDEELD